MKTVKELVAINPDYLSSDRHYGLEIEVEGTKLPRPGDLPATWRVERDNSLKTAEAWEYVLAQPTTLDGLNKAVNVLEYTYKLKGSVVDDSVRAGVHIHLNVQDWSVLQLMTFATCYYIVEDILLNWCGENREGNLFCLRTRDAEYVLFKLLEAMEERNLKHLNTEQIRYSSLNYCSLFKYGTIEFRGMRGTPDLSLIKKWAAIIDELRTTSMQFSNPLSVMDQFSGDGEVEFLKTLFPTFWEEFNHPNKEQTIRDSVRRVQMLAYGIDWSKISVPAINPFTQRSF